MSSTLGAISRPRPGGTHHVDAVTYPFGDYETSRRLPRRENSIGMEGSVLPRVSALVAKLDGGSSPPLGEEAATGLGVIGVA